MDQSNAETIDNSDRMLRSYSVNTAAQLAATPEGYAQDTMKLARAIYLFMDCRDPIVDQGRHKSHESSLTSIEEIMEAVEQEHPAELSNIIYLEDYRRVEERDEEEDDDGAY